MSETVITKAGDAYGLPLCVCGCASGGMFEEKDSIILKNSMYPVYLKVN